MWTVSTAKHKMLWCAAPETQFVAVATHTRKGIETLDDIKLETEPIVATHTRKGIETVFFI